MGLRDRIASAITGIPSTTDRRFDLDGDGRPLPRASRRGKTREIPAISTRGTRSRALQLAIEGSSTSLPESRCRSREQGFHTSASTQASQHNSPTDANSNLASGRALPEAAASTPALSLSKTSRPYGGTGNQEAFTLDPPPRFTHAESRGTAARGSATSFSTVANRPNVALNPRGQGDEGDDLVPLSEREIIDVTDEDSLSQAGATVRPQSPAGGQRTRFQQTSRAPSPPRADRFRSGSQTRASGEPGNQPRALYLGVFGLDEADQSSPRPTSNTHERPSQGFGSSGRASSFGQRSPLTHTLTSSHHTTVINRSYGFGTIYSVVPPPFYPPYSHPFTWYPDWVGYPWPWVGLPWWPRATIILPRQTIFTEISTDYFEQDSPATPQLDSNTSLGVINRYYNGWRDAYAQALIHGGVTGEGRVRIERNRERLRERHDEAVRRLRNGDHNVVREVLEQVRMDRRMAVDMPVEQVRWATPWIREVWITGNGEIPN